MKNKKWKIIFHIRYDFYKILIINFELCGAFFIFQNYINDILHEYFDNFYIVYINDILIYNKNKKKTH